jgi:uncharacterized caspase-like protein
MISVVAKNGSGESSPVTLHVVYQVQAPEKRLPSMQVLAVGVSQYADPKINALRFASRDAEDIDAVYRKQSGKLFKTVTVNKLVNPQATRANLVLALENMRKTLTPDDTAIIFVSSHGFADNDEFFFALNDASLEDISKTGISWREILKRLEDLPAKYVVLMVDQCHSGGVQDELLRGYHPANEAYRAARQSNILAFCASNADEVSWEHPQWQHGAFTYALLKALRGETREVVSDGGNILLSKVDDYVTGEVERIVKEVVGSKQTPSLFCLPHVYKRFPIARL